MADPGAKLQALLGWPLVVAIVAPPWHGVTSLSPLYRQRLVHQMGTFIGWYFKKKIYRRLVTEAGGHSNLSPKVAN